MNVLTSHTAISSALSSLLPYLGKSPSVLKSVIIPYLFLIGVTFAYLIAESESASNYENYSLSNGHLYLEIGE